LLELLLLALAASVWPALIAVVVVAVRTVRPATILLSFLVGGLITTVAEGAAIVFALRGSSFISGPRPAADPTILITVGFLALLAAYGVHRRGDASRNGGGQHEKRKAVWSRWVGQAVRRGGWLAFLAGVVLNIVPGLFPLVALKDIAENDDGAVETAAVILCFYLVMFWMLEIPLLMSAMAPDKTSRVVTAFDAWLTNNGRKIATIALIAVGLYVMVRGVIALFR
jgi:Sap, sulfolipid-1-addressing protein